MSETVSKALLLTGGSEAFETSLFIGKVDKFFDALNVSSYTKGLKARKPFQKPYVSKDDSRLQVGPSIQITVCKTTVCCNYCDYLYIVSN